MPRDLRPTVRQLRPLTDPARDRRRRRNAPVRLAVAVAAVLALGAAIAAASGAVASGGGTISGCVAKHGGRLRVIDNSKQQRCKRGEKPLSWNTRGQTGPVGPAGVAGPAGADGAPGEPGRSALEPLRSGETIRGVVGADEHALTTGVDFAVLETFPIPAPRPVDDQDVAIDEGRGDEGDRCTGTADAPSAPAGVVCIYPNRVANGGTIAGGPAVSDAGSRFGFQLAWRPLTAGDTFVQASWAYQAP